MTTRASTPAAPSSSPSRTGGPQADGARSKKASTKSSASKKASFDVSRPRNGSSKANAGNGADAAPAALANLELSPRQAQAYARRIAEKLLDGKVGRVRALGGGLTNLVYEVVRGDEAFVVRMGASAGKVKEFLKEQWAMARVREIGVPTPEVLEVGAEIVPLPYMLARKVPGSEATDHPDRLEILREVGRLTALIHTVPTGGYGRTFDWSSNVLSRRETWKDYLHGELEIAAKMEMLAENDMLEAPALKRLRAIWAEVERWTDPPVLNHGDMRLKNVMVNEDGAVTAVIDWEFCSANVAPYWDLSIALHDLDVDQKEAFVEGYGLSETRMREIAPVLKAINLVNYAPHVARAAKTRDKAKLDHFRTRLSGAFDLYSL